MKRRNMLKRLSALLAAGMLASFGALADERLATPTDHVDLDIEIVKVQEEEPQAEVVLSEPVEVLHVTEEVTEEPEAEPVEPEAEAPAATPTDLEPEAPAEEEPEAEPAEKPEAKPESKPAEEELPEEAAPVKKDRAGLAKVTHDVALYVDKGGEEVLGTLKRGAVVQAKANEGERMAAVTVTLTNDEISGYIRADVLSFMTSQDVKAFAQAHPELTVGSGESIRFVMLKHFEAVEMEEPAEESTEEPVEAPEEEITEEPVEESEEDITGEPEEESTEEPVEESAEESAETEAPAPVVAISVDAPAVLRAGDIIRLNSEVQGLEGKQLIYQWECDMGEGFVAVEGATEESYAFEANAESLCWKWRLMVRYT